MMGSGKWSEKLVKLSKSEIDDLTEDDMLEIVEELGEDLKDMPDDMDAEMKSGFVRLYEVAKETMQLIKDKKEAENERDASRLARAMTKLESLKWESVELMARMVRIGKKDFHEKIHEYADNFAEKFVDMVEVEEEENGYDPWETAETESIQEEKEASTSDSKPEEEADELTILKSKLTEAIAAEKYEEAANLRDQIKKME